MDVHEEHAYAAVRKSAKKAFKRACRHDDVETAMESIKVLTKSTSEILFWAVRHSRGQHKVVLHLLSLGMPPATRMDSGESAFRISRRYGQDVHGIRLLLQILLDAGHCAYGELQLTIYGETSADDDEVSVLQELFPSLQQLSRRVIRSTLATAIEKKLDDLGALVVPLAKSLHPFSLLPQAYAIHTIATPLEIDFELRRLPKMPPYLLRYCVSAGILMIKREEESLPE